MTSRSGSTAFAAALDAALLGLVALAGCGGGAKPAPPREEQSLERLDALERDLGRSAPSRPEKAPADAPSDAEADERLRAALARARVRRAEQDAAQAALPSQESAALLAFAETYRPAKEIDAGPVEHYLYGRALLLAGRSSEARYRYELALRHEPRFAVARAALGLWHFRFEEWAEAEKQLAAAWREDRTDPEVAFYLAYTCEKLGQPERSYALMVEALSAGRGEEPAALWLAAHHGAKEEHAEIVRILQPIVAKYPANEQLRLRLAAAYEELGRVDDAIRELEELLPRMQGGWVQMLRYGELLRRDDRFAEAERVFRRVLEEAPAKFLDEDLGADGKRALEQRIALVQQEQRAGRKLVRTRDELLSILKNHQTYDVEERIEAARLIAQDRPPADGKALGSLVQTLVYDPDPRVRIWAPRMLQAWAVPSEAERFLRWLAKNPNEDLVVRAASCEAFDSSASDLAVDVLLECLGGEAQLFHAANAALQRITGQVVVLGDGSYLDDKPDSRKKKQEEWRMKVQRLRERREAAKAAAR